MHWLIELSLYLFLFAAGLIALEVKDLMAAAITTTVFSFVIATLFVAMGAVDVGFTEGVVGAGIVGVYFIAMVLRTSRRTKD